MLRQMSVIVKNLLFARNVVTKDSHLIKSQIVSKMYGDNLQI